MISFQDHDQMITDIDSLRRTQRIVKENLGPHLEHLTPHERKCYKTLVEPDFNQCLNAILDLRRVLVRGRKGANK